MIYTRRYVQYNDLPFDNYEMLRSWDDTTVKFKQDSSQYTFKHGSYTVFKSEEMLVEETNVSMTVLLEMQRLACDKASYYRKFVLNEFSKPGKLWAVQNGELVWAYAYPSSMSEASSVSVANGIQIDIDFTLYEGIWHKANAFTTFLEPYDICELFEYKTTPNQCEEYNKRKNFDCCIDCIPDLTKKDRGTCECKEITEEVENPCGCKDECGNIITSTVVVGKECDCKCKELVESKPTLFDETCGCDCGKNSNRKNLCEVNMSLFYGQSGCSTTGYKIVEDCSVWERESGEPIGTKFRAEACSNYLSGKVYSNTDVNTTDYEIIVTGTFHNLYIEVNGNGNVIEGDYSGSLKVRGDGTAWILNGDCGWEELPVSSITIPEGNELGYTFTPEWNQFKIDAGECDCNETLTAYINIDNITY